MLKNQILRKIRLLETEWSLADGQTDKHNQANIPFLQFFEKRLIPATISNFQMWQTHTHTKTRTKSMASQPLTFRQLPFPERKELALSIRHAPCVPLISLLSHVTDFHTLRTLCHWRYAQCRMFYFHAFSNNKMADMSECTTWWWPPEGRNM